MLTALLLAAAQPPVPAVTPTPDPYAAYTQCRLGRAQALIEAGAPDHEVRERPFEECFPLRGAAVEALRAAGNITRDAGLTGAALEGIIERRVDEALASRAARTAPALPAAFQSYYDCAASRAASLAVERGRPKEEIVAAALAECAPGRAAALEAGLVLMSADPRVREWERTHNVTAEESRRIGEREFHRALRRQLIINIRRIRGEPGEAPDAED